MDKFDDTDVAIAACRALGLTILETAEHVGIGDNTVSDRIAKRRPFYERTIPTIQAIKSRLDAKTAAKSGAVVENAWKSAEDRIKALFDRSFRVTERVIEQAELLGDQITLAEAMEIHKSITQWAGKFVASEAPKRISNEGKVEVTHRHVIGFREALTAHKTAAEIDAIRVLPQLPEAQEAEIVS